MLFSCWIYIFVWSMLLTLFVPATQAHFASQKCCSQREKRRRNSFRSNYMDRNQLENWAVRSVIVNLCILVKATSIIFAQKKQIIKLQTVKFPPTTNWEKKSIGWSSLSLQSIVASSRAHKQTTFLVWNFSPSSQSARTLRAMLMLEN